MNSTNDFGSFLEHTDFLVGQMRKVASSIDDSITKHFCDVVKSIVDAARGSDPKPINPDWDKNFKARVKNHIPKPDCLKTLELLEDVLRAYEEDIFSVSGMGHDYEKVVFNSIGVLAQLLKRGFLSPPIVEQLVNQINEYVPQSAN